MTLRIPCGTRKDSTAEREAWGGKNLTEKGAVTHHHSSLKFWSG